MPIKKQTATVLLAAILLAGANPDETQASESFVQHWSVGPSTVEQLDQTTYCSPCSLPWPFEEFRRQD